IFTGDWHAYGDREIDTEHPDALKGTYPPHCMGMSPDASERSGAALIHEIDPGESALVLDRDANPATASKIAQAATESGRPIFIQKREFSCFEGNLATEPLLEALTVQMNARPHVIVCGVATDVCVRYAVDGLLDRGLEVSIVRDATWALGLLPASETWERWASRGAHIVMVDALATLEA
ncbi:MAG: isochorismatase family protein, partial [Gemmatimonadaceae bacterium]